MKKLNVKKNTNKPEIPGKVKKGYRIYVMAVLALTLTMSMGMTAFAAGDPITVVNNLSDFIFGLIRAVGLILLGWGIVQVGLSFQSHDPSQRSNGFLTLAGGVVHLVTEIEIDARNQNGWVVRKIIHSLNILVMRCESIE